MMKKLFCVSDLHSFFTPFKRALDEAGFDKNNENHWLIVCGDIFDRGPESAKMLEYLIQLERKVFVKGNHDILLEDLCARKFPYMYDMQNGTMATVNDLGGQKEGKEFYECCVNTWNRLARYRELLVNYFETKNYIFVHSWIPTIKSQKRYLVDKLRANKNEYIENWRDASDAEWEEAMWNNPFELAEQGLNKTGKTIVFGHWHCSTGWAKDEGCSEFGPDAEWNPYYGKGIIGIDRCTAHTKECNVLVLEDDFLEV